MLISLALIPLVPHADVVDALVHQWPIEFKAVFTLGAPVLGTKWCCVQTLGTRYIIAQFSSRVQGRDLVLGQSGTVPEFWRGYLKKWCVHISAHQESFSGTVLGQQERSLRDCNLAVEYLKSDSKDLGLVIYYVIYACCLAFSCVTYQEVKKVR